MCYNLLHAGTAKYIPGQLTTYQDTRKRIFRKIFIAQISTFEQISLLYALRLNYVKAMGQIIYLKKKNRKVKLVRQRSITKFSPSKASKKKQWMQLSSFFEYTLISSESVYICLKCYPYSPLTVLVLTSQVLFQLPYPFSCSFCLLQCFSLNNIPMQSKKVNWKRWNQNHIVLSIKGKDRHLQLYSHKSTDGGQGQQPFS